MTADANMFRAKLRQALDRVGRSNGHACPETNSNIDRVLHELLVASEAMSYFKTRLEAATKEAYDVSFAAEELEEIIDSVVHDMQGRDVIAASGDLYQLTMSISKPSKRLNQTALRNALKTQFAIDPKKVDALFDECSNYATPAKRLKVMNL